MLLLLLLLLLMMMVTNVSHEGLHDFLRRL